MGNPKGYAFIGFPGNKIKGVYVGGDGVAYVYDLPELDPSLYVPQEEK